MGYWTEIEKGAVLGFFAGILILLFSYFSGVGFQEAFCPEFRPDICLRHISFFPFFLTILGAVFGFVIKIKRRQHHREHGHH